MAGERTALRAGRPVAAIAIVLLGAVCGALLVAPGGDPVARNVEFLARQYYYSPHRIVVNEGDTVRVHLAADDVVHGFYLEGHDIDAMVVPGEMGFRARGHDGDERYDKVDEVVFIAGSPGKYRYRCSVTCGTLHPFMQGELVVRPNRVFGAGMGASAGVLAAALLLMFTAPARAPSKRPWRWDLLKTIPPLRWWVTRRWFNFSLLLPCLVVLLIFLLAGFFGSPIGNRNIIVTIVWIFWWFLLITFLVPFGGRVWCMMCPLPATGEWLARGKIVDAGTNNIHGRLHRPLGLKKKWPKKLSNLWIQNLGFLTVCSISTILVTRPALTAFVLLGMLIVATGIHLVYRNRTFCSYLCPLNSWMSLYAMTAMTEVRARDRSLGATCRERACVVDSYEAWGCPWFVNPGKLDRNNYCGLCMECIKACPNGNMTVRARPFCSDTRICSLDEAWMAFIMIVLSLAYTVAFLGPWGEVKIWTDVTEFGHWGRYFQYTVLVWFLALAVMPGLWFGVSWLGRRLSGLNGTEAPGMREAFLRTSYMLVPLGLMAWMAFSLPLILVNVTHITTTLSDPMGWGWDLFGTAHDRWKPLWPEKMVLLQIPLLLIGLFYALKTGFKVAREMVDSPRRAAGVILPQAVLCTAIVIAFIRLFAG